MKPRLGSSFMLLIVLLSLFFEYALPCHGHFTRSDSGVSYRAANDTAGTSGSPQDMDDDCPNGNCHFGYCKLITPRGLHFSFFKLRKSNYPLSTQSIPEAPSLRGSRKPPKAA